jgi:hypothetical protein
MILQNRQEFVEGKKSGEWIKILPVIEYGKTQLNPC